MESMPFTGTDEIHMRAPTCKYADSKSGFNDMVGIEIRYRQGNLAVFFLFWVEAAFSYRKPSPWGVCEAAFSLLPMEGGAPKGRRLALAEV